MKKISKLSMTMACCLALLMNACSPASNPNQTETDQALLSKFSSTNKIVNGESVKDEDPISKSTVALYLLLSTTEGTVANFCTGTLIKKNVILTAAHCLKDASELELKVPIEKFVSRILVGFGTNVVDNISDSRVSFIKVKHYAVHPEYVSGSVSNALKKPMPDMALLQMESDAPESFIPANLGVNPDLLQEGTEVTLAGYGYTSGVEKTKATQLMKVNIAVTVPHLTKTQFGFIVVDGKTACSGDSGGPAYITSGDQELTVVGVTSWGDNQCVRVGAYTSVSALENFIKDSLTSFGY